MQSQLRLRPCVIAAKQKLAEGREKLQQTHQAGTPGFQVCAKMADLLDEIILIIFNAAAEEITPENPESLAQSISLVAHGGYGRRDVAPYSDVDLMLLHRPNAMQEGAALAKRLTQDVFDAGLQLGLSIRTTEQARSLALRDPATFTSLSESRLLYGDEPLFLRFMSKLEPLAYRRQAMINQIVEARRDERKKFGETVFLLRPNIKRSRGALRDIQLIRWIGFARYGETDLDKLTGMRALETSDRRKLIAAHEFLLRLRNELHFFAGKPQDGLGRNEQVRVADLWNYEGSEGVLPVERFMRDYFKHTSNIRYIAAHLLARSRSRGGLKKMVSPVFSFKIDGDFRIGPFHVGATRTGLEKIQGNLVEVLRMMEIANTYSRRIEHTTWEAIRESMVNRDDIEMGPETAERFMSLLSETGRLAPLIRRLHEMRVLEKILPAFRHARCLLQFNEYHKYTVDEHSIRALQRATDFASENSPVGEIYRSIRYKRTLHLALLLHDLGKGYTEDHSEVGLKIADETTKLLGLPEQESETVKFLVHKHLMMAHLALRRDTSDENVIAHFAAEVGSVETLKMLLILTCSDLHAVGPDVLNDWKMGLLLDFYRKTKRQLSGESAVRVGKPERRREEILAIAAEEKTTEHCEKHLLGLSPNYLNSQSAQKSYDDLLRLQDVQPENSVCWAEFNEDSKAVEFMIGTFDSPNSGIFHRATGTLSGSGYEILSAEIMRLAESMILLRFQLRDLDFINSTPTQLRLTEVTDRLKKAVDSKEDSPPTFRTVWRASDGGRAAKINRLPTRVRIDNEMADDYTIIDIFAHDCVGLLYTISKSLFELHLDVGFAKIGTYLDQVVDVFYIMDQNGRKITDGYRLNSIRDYLLTTIEEFEDS